MRKLTIGMGGPQTLADAPGAILRVVADDTHVYWIEPGDVQGNNATGRVMRIPRDGGTAIELAIDQETPLGLAVDDTAVYWTTNGDGTTGRLWRRWK